MTAAPFVFSMVFRADVAAARAGLASVQDGLGKVGLEAGKATAATKKEAAELDALAAAAGRAALSQQDLAAAARKAAMAPQLPLARLPVVADTASMFRATATAADAMRASVSGATVGLDGVGTATNRAMQEAVVYRGSLDAIRASFNPLFAASRQYEAQLEAIATAEQMGAISAREAAAARERAAQAMAPAGANGMMASGGRQGSFVTANLAAQGNDIAMMAMAGQNPLQLALQQGTQVSQVLNGLEKGTSIPKTLAAGFMSMVNPVSLVTIGVIGLGAAGLQALGGLSAKSKSFAETLAALGKSTEAYVRSSQRAANAAAQLRAEFGLGADSARRLLADIADLDRRQASRDLGATMRKMPEDLGLRQLQDPAGDADDIRKFFGLSTWKKESWEMAHAVRQAYIDAGNASGIDKQIAALKVLQAEFDKADRANPAHSPKSETARRNINNALLDAERQKASAANEAGKARADDLTKSLERQTELTRIGVQYGADSVELRAAEARQAREALAVELERVGIVKGSPEWNAAMAAQARKSFAERDAADKARDDAQKAYLGDQDAAIAALTRELQLLGVSNAERIRQNALAEVAVEIGRENLSNDEARERRTRAIAKATAEIALESERAARAQQLARVTDGIEAQIGLARDPVSKAELEAAREYAEVMDRTSDAAEAQQAADRARARSLVDALSGSQLQIASLSDELAVRQRVAAQVVAGTVAATDADRVMRQELELLPLIRAEARATGAEKQRLASIIIGLRVASEALAAEERRGQANAALRSSAERIAAARVELALIGQTAEARARVLGLIEAERVIRETGMDASSEQAQALRDGASGLARMTAEIERQGAAWKAVQSAGESAIDGVLDKLTGGDVKGALADLAQEASKLFLDLGVRNPLKNAVLGSGLPTMADAGGLAGMLGRLVGGGFDEAGTVRMGAAQVQAMTVAATAVQLTAGTVNINGAPGLLPGMAANLPGVPGVAGVAAGGVAASGPVAVGAAQDVARQVWEFFSAKGLAPHQVAGIMGNVKAESAFNPLAKGDHVNGDPRAFGLFQWNDRRHKLFDFIGGRGGLGDIHKQLEFAWHELQTSESGPLRRLKASTDVRGATEAFLGFERPRNYSLANPAASEAYDKRLNGASQALAQFGASAQAATVQTAAVPPTMASVASAAQAASAGVDTMASGMTQLGSGLQQMLGAALSGDKGGVMSGLLGLGFKFMTGGLGAAPAPGFATGGFTGAGHPAAVAGVVHAGEYVFDAAATSRIGVGALEAMRSGRGPGYASGGYVSGAAPRVPGGSVPGGGGAAGGSAPATRAAPVLHFDMRGAIGGAELQRGVKTAINEAFKSYDRDQLPVRVKAVMANPHRRQG